MSRPHRVACALPLLALACLCSPVRAQLQPNRAPPGPAARDSIEAAIRAVQSRLVEAAGRLSADALFAHVLDTPTPPIIEDGVVRPDRASALASTSAGLRGLNSISYHYTRQHITVLTPTLALWVGEGTAAATLADGSERGAPFAETVLYMLHDGEWQVLHAHRSSPNLR